MKFLTTAIAFLAVFGAKCYDPCRTRPREDNIQSGTVQFTNGYNFKETCFTVNIDFDIPQSGLKTAISTVSHDGFNTKNGLDYSIRAKKKSNANALNLSLLSSDKAWRKIVISYLATSKDDLYLGSFIEDTFSLFGCENQSINNAIIEQSITGLPLSNNIRYNVAAYISGVRTQKDKVNLQLSDEKVDGRNGLLSMKVNSNTNSIQNLHISYVIWRQGSYDFRVLRPTDNLNPDYKLIGVYSFSNSKQLTQTLAIFSDRLSCIGYGCPNTCTNKSQCLSKGGQLYGNTCVICSKNQKYWDGKCMPNCGYRYVFDKGNCICDKGYVQWSKQCLQPCALGEQRNINGICQCRNGLIKLGGICRECPQFSKLINGSCVCNSDCRWDDSKYLCIKLPPPPPPIPQNLCPPRSSWNPSKLCCDCTYPEQYMINNKCQRCPDKQAWNGKQCVCTSGLNKVNGRCVTCDINSTYDGRNCVCNWGFYGNANQKCQRCHVTCGKCKGPGANQCEACTDVSLQLNNGYCSKNSCPPGFYVDPSTSKCALCSSYCAQCVGQNVCTKCVSGFKIQQANVEGIKFAGCTQICGDGRRFEDDCDDGNQYDGDGCSKLCRVQKDYTCQGGSSQKKSTCVKFTPDRCIINPTKSVNVIGKIMQGVRLTYIPKQLTDNQCPNCYKILNVKVISSSVVPGIRVAFIPKSQYQFICQFDFNGLWAIPVFTISVQINPQMARYFSAQDMAQIQIIKIDPAVLARIDHTQELNMGDVDNVISQNITNLVFQH